MSITQTIANFFQQGGPFMFPIAIVLALGVAVAIERFVFLSIAKRTNKSAFPQIEPIPSPNRDEPK